MILREVIDRVQSLYSQGIGSDDSRLRPRQIYSKVKTSRSLIVASEVRKTGRSISDFNLQTIPCIQLIKAPIHECPCVPSGCLVYRSEEKLPKPISGWSKHMIDSVSKLDGSQLFSETTWERKRYKSADKYTASRPDYYIRNDYLYLTSNEDDLTMVAVTGLFEDPVEVFLYETPCTTEDDCTSIFDMNFPMDYAMLEKIAPMAIDELVKVFNSAEEDASNNARDTKPEK